MIEWDKISRTFCSSPWVHIRIGVDGAYHPCRWTAITPTGKYKADTTTPIEYFNSDEMNEFRHGLLTGKSPDVCRNCYYEDSFGKLSGRQKQLFRFGLSCNAAENVEGNQNLSKFEYSYLHSGETTSTPIDFQIVTSNICNSSCIMCGPKSSSKIGKELTSNPDLQELSQINNIPPSWRLSPSAVKNIVDGLSKLDNINYIHLIGGEPFYDPVFKDLLRQFVDTGLSKRVICGTAINATIYDEEVMQLMSQFKDFHLGISIESITSLNDYVRPPSSIEVIKGNIEKIINYSKNSGNFLIHFRPTPNIFSVYELDKLFDYFISLGISWETCDILAKPSYLRMELLPDDIRIEALNKLIDLVDRHNIDLNVPQEPDTRNPNNFHKVIANSVRAYIDFLTVSTTPENVEEDRTRLVKVLTKLESIRKNRILDHLPRYETFLRKYGYEGKSTSSR